jgi:hypothetical protein
MPISQAFTRRLSFANARWPQAAAVPDLLFCRTPATQRDPAMTLIRLFFALVLLSATGAFAQSAPRVEVYKNAACSCCGGWVDHLRENGFAVTTHDIDDVPANRKTLGMPEELGSCHTAKVDGYVIEGHVPAADIKRLLKDKPKALGLAVPSMPAGSPGMESPRPVPYDTLLVERNGSTSVYARH